MITGYIGKRLLMFFFLLVASSTVVFCLVRLIPGDPGESILGENSNPQDINRIRQELNLDKPLLIQYGEYIKNLSSFSLGYSLIDRQPVSKRIKEYFPNTLLLATAAILIAIMISFPLGVWGAFKSEMGIGTDSLITLSSSLGLSIPAFILGPVLVIIFSIKLGWLPVSGSDSLSHLVLPSVTLGIFISGSLTRLVRQVVSIEMKKDYVLLARAKGLNEFCVFQRHIFKNAMIPIITATSIQLGVLLGGTVVTETVFSWQGIGTLLVSSIHTRDYTMIQGIVLVITAIYLVLGFIVDIIYFFFDPRMRYEYESKKIPH